MKSAKNQNILEKIISSINLNEEYTYSYALSSKINELKKPNQHDDIRCRINLFANNTNKPDIDAYLNEKNSSEMEFYNYFSKNIPPRDSMNPHIKPYPPSEYFVDEIDKEKLKHLNELNDLISVNKNGKLKITECDDGILHIGEKGSGKTFSQNIWLHENHEELEKNNIFWVRLDFGKLLDIWKEKNINNKNEFLSTEDYLMGQISYVFAKHFINEFPLYSPFIGKIVDKLRIDDFYNKIDYDDYALNKKDLLDGSDLEYVNTYFKNDKRKINTIIDALYFFEKNIAIYEGFYKGKQRKGKNKRRKGKKGYLIDKVFLDSQKNIDSNRKGSKTVWTFIGQRIREFILENNYHILYIIDGIDNLSFHHSNREILIDNAYEEILKFPLKEERIFKNELVLISLRYTSYEDLINKINSEEYNDNSKFRDLEKFKKIYQDSNGVPNAALKRRISYVMEEMIENKSYMKKVLNFMYEYNNVLDEKRWYSNIRTFIHNHLNLAKLITYRYYFAGKPENFDIRSQIDTFENINFLLNGNLYINESKKTPKSNSGYNFFNLFGYSIDGNPIYFIYTRILQIILDENHLNKDQLYKRLDLFNYSENDIDFCLDRLNRRGFIMINYTTYAKYNSILYSITSKGRYALQVFYSDIHFLYHTSIDTVLSNKIVEQLKYSPNHFNENYKKTFYPPYSIITAIHFLKHLIKCNNFELKMIKNTKNINVEPFRLPIDIDLLKDSILSMVDASIKDTEYFEVLLNEY